MNFPQFNDCAVSVLFLIYCVFQGGRGERDRAAAAGRERDEESGEASRGGGG